MSLTLARPRQPLLPGAEPSDDTDLPDAPYRENQLLTISLFGRPHFEYDGAHVGETASGRALELFCYLLLHRDKPHHREVLAGVLWGDRCTTKQSKSYLRKALWQLHTSLSTDSGCDLNVVAADGDWVQIPTDAAYSLDVAILEDSFRRVRDVHGAEMTAEEAACLSAAASIYTTDLLEGWYQEWCLIERERLQQIYLLMLDKLMSYCERTGAYETGIEYGDQSLARDAARERTYRLLIRLYHALGDRTGAIRTYERCTSSIRAELDAAPSPATVALIERVRNGTVADSGSSEAVGDDPAGLNARLQRVSSLQRQLTDLHERVLREIEEIRRSLSTTGRGEK